MAQLVGAPSCTPTGCGFDPRAGRVQEATNWCFSHQCFSLFQKKINKHIFGRGLEGEGEAAAAAAGAAGIL